MNITGNFTEDTLKTLWKVNKENTELKQELQRKDNIINELKSHLESEISEWQDVSNEWTKAQVQEDKIILDKIKDIENER